MLLLLHDIHNQFMHIPTVATSYTPDFVGPPALTVNITKNVGSSSIVVQWDAVDDSLITAYIVTWTSERDHNLQSATLIEQSSFTITGLTLDTVYTITVTAANRCGYGPEVIASISFPADTTSTTSSISPTVTASTNPMAIMSTAILSTTITIASPMPTGNISVPGNDTTSKLD